MANTQMEPITQCEFTEYYEYALSDFNFYKVSFAVKALGMEWKPDCEDSCCMPSINMLRNICNKLFNKAYERTKEQKGGDRFACCVSGFKVTIFEEPDPYVKIEFILEESDY